MKNLILIRHAKSDWSLSLDDFDRTLTQRGRDDAALVAKQLNGILPDPLTIWSSSARRASSTAEIMCNVWDFPLSSVDFRYELYTFAMPSLEELIRNAPDEIENLMIFGHNEAVTDFVNNFGDIYVDNVPTSGLVWLRFEQSRWKDIGNGMTIRTEFPKSLR